MQEQEQECEVLKMRSQGQETKYKVKIQGHNKILIWGVKFYSIFLVCTGEYIYDVKFLKWKADNW